MLVIFEPLGINHQAAHRKYHVAGPGQATENFVREPIRQQVNFPLQGRRLQNELVPDPARDMGGRVRNVDYGFYQDWGPGLGSE